VAPRYWDLVAERLVAAPGPPRWPALRRTVRLVALVCDALAPAGHPDRVSARRITLSVRAIDEPAAGLRRTAHVPGDLAPMLAGGQISVSAAHLTPPQMSEDASAHSPALLLGRAPKCWCRRTSRGRSFAVLLLAIRSDCCGCARIAAWSPPGKLSSCRQRPHRARPPAHI
jgi:hypothetical protein